MIQLETSCPIKANPTYPYTDEMQEKVKSNLMKIIEVLKQKMINLLKKYRKLQPNRQKVP